MTTQTNDTCSSGRPSGSRRPGAGRTAMRRTRVRVSSDAVVYAYIRDIAQPHAGEAPSAPRPTYESAPDDDYAVEHANLY